MIVVSPVVSGLVDVACRLGGPRFAFRVHLHRMQRWQALEPEFFLLDRLVDPARAAVDIGANEGFYAGRLSRLCGRVHCFEPIPWLAEALGAKLPRSVVIHKSALSNRTGIAELRIPYNDDVEMHYMATVDEHNRLDGYSSCKVVSCRLERLDDALHEPVGFIKIDVEGHELAVLEGAEGILARDRPVLLFESEVRHNAEAPGAVFDFLSRRGYEGFFLEEGRLRSVADFDPGVHQQVAELKSRSGLYINNFLFCVRPFPPGIASLLAEQET